MDISTILPLLMSGGGFGSGSGGAGSLAPLLSAFGKTNSAQDPTAALIASLMNKSGGEANGNANNNLINLLTLANKSRTENRRPMGIRPIKDIIPNDLLGIMIKCLNR